MKREKQIIILLSFFLLLSCLISGAFSVIYKADNERVKRYPSIEHIDPIEEDLYFYGHDPVGLNNGMLVITGWIAPKNADLSHYINRCVILEDDQGQCFAVNTVAYDRDLTSYFNTGFNYDLGGIWAQCPTSQFDEGSTYRVYFLLTEADGSQFLYDLDTTVTI